MIQSLRSAAKILATWFGITAGIAGLDHGYFEILQGNTRTGSLMIASIGPPCVPVEVWNACEPALNIIPNFQISGIFSIIVGLLIIAWSAAFIQHRQGGLVLIFLSVALLMVGGGFFPPLIGIVGGIAGTRINKPLSKILSLILNYIVAFQTLYRYAKVNESDKILIIGASGGIGTAFLQLGKLAGLKMYGMASKIKHQVLSDYGTTPIDYHTQDFTKVIQISEPEGLDAVFDGIG